MNSSTCETPGNRASGLRGLQAMEAAEPAADQTKEFAALYPTADDFVSPSGEKRVGGADLGGRPNLGSKATKRRSGPCDAAASVGCVPPEGSSVADPPHKRIRAAID